MTNRIELTGMYNTATVFTDKIDDDVRAQIIQLLNEAFIAGEHIAIMPDTHVGKGAVVGLTMTTKNQKVCPNLVGADIGCGIMVTAIEAQKLNINDFERLDQVIRQYIPSGFAVNQQPGDFTAMAALSFPMAKPERMAQSLGSLGGGNHFIELSQNQAGNYFLLIHSGSRAFGHTISTHHQQLALNYCHPEAAPPRVKDPQLSYLEDDLLADYLHDLHIAQDFAHQNRRLMTERILQHMHWSAVDQFDVAHNYIDAESGILRKGAIDAAKGQRLVIPLNMRDGSLFAVGRGNPEWNYSAPHGAGRILSRSQAKAQLSLEAFQLTMRDVYSTTVTRATLDEAPMAYKDIRDILGPITATADIIEQIKPVYNFKAD